MVWTGTFSHTLLVRAKHMSCGDLKIPYLHVRSIYHTGYSKEEYPFFCKEKQGGEKVPRFRVQIQIRERHKLMFLFLLGLVGCAFFVRKAGVGAEEEILSGGSAFFVKLAEEDTAGMMPHFLWHRSILPAVWIGLSFTALGAVSLYLCWLYLGFAMGAFLWAVMVYGGWRGPFYFWGLVFPHYLLYAPALLLLYIACLRWNHFWMEHRRYRRRIAPANPQVRLFAVRLTLGLLLYGLGIWSECCLNPWIFKRIFIKP